MGGKTVHTNTRLISPQQSFRNVRDQRLLWTGSFHNGNTIRPRDSRAVGLLLTWMGEGPMSLGPLTSKWLIKPPISVH